MEIYKDLSNPASKEFEKLLNSQFTKNENLEDNCLGSFLCAVGHFSCLTSCKDILGFVHPQTNVWIGAPSQ